MMEVPPSPELEPLRSLVDQVLQPLRERRDEEKGMLGKKKSKFYVRSKVSTHNRFSRKQFADNMSAVMSKNRL